MAVALNRARGEKPRRSWPVQAGTVVYGNRTSTGQIMGFGGSAKRSIGSKLLESQLESLLREGAHRDAVRDLRWPA